MTVQKLCVAFMGIAGLALASCSSDSGSGTSAEANNEDTIQVVTSTKVWSDIAAAVVGPDATSGAEAGNKPITITPIISSNNTDPHSYQPTAADMALVENADILVAGGGHYDAWITKAASDQGDHVIISALAFDDEGHAHEHAHDDHADHSEHAHDEHADHDHGDAEINEHVWYNVDKVIDFAEELASELDLEASGVVKQMEEIQERKADIPAAKTAQIHPLADDILADTAIEDITPAGYRATTLAEAEPSAADVNAMLELINSGELDYLINAPQTADSISQRLVEAAQVKGIRIINVYESPSNDQTYFQLYQETLDQLEEE